MKTRKLGRAGVLERLERIAPVGAAGTRYPDPMMGALNG
jgi:hypothetical protein